MSAQPKNGKYKKAKKERITSKETIERKNANHDTKIQQKKNRGKE